MQVPKKAPLPQSVHDIQQSALYGNVKKQNTLRGCIYFWMGGLFPFVSDMRHTLLNLSSVRHSTNLQFTNKEFSVGWNCRVTPKKKKKGKIICKLVHCNVLSESWNGCLPWYAEERWFFLGGVLFLNQTCPSHKTCHRPPSPAASAGGRWHTPVTLAIGI